MAKTLTVKPQKSQQLTTWEEQLAQDAKDIAATEDVTGRFISCRGAAFHYHGTKLENPLQVIVLDHILENAYYEGDFDPDQPASPVCFALDRDVKDMKPHDLSVKKQHPTCAGCPRNEFGTAERGKGKACKNVRRLAIMLPGQLDNAATADIAYLKPPVTSVKEWSKYVNGLSSAMNRPPYSMVTEITNSSDPKTQFKLTFKAAGTIDMEKYFTSVINKRKEVMQTIMFPYQPQATKTEEETKPARRRKY